MRLLLLEVLAFLLSFGAAITSWEFWSVDAVPFSDIFDSQFVIVVVFSSE